MSFTDQLEALKTQIKPRFTVPMDMIPEAKDWKVGEKYEISLTVVQKEVRELTPGKNEVTFEIEEIEVEMKEDEEDISMEDRVARLEQEAQSFETA